MAKTALKVRREVPVLREKNAVRSCCQSKTENVGTSNSRFTNVKFSIMAQDFIRERDEISNKIIIS